MAAQQASALRTSLCHFAVKVGFGTNNDTHEEKAHAANAPELSAPRTTKMPAPAPSTWPKNQTPAGQRAAVRKLQEEERLVVAAAEV